MRLPLSVALIPTKRLKVPSESMKLVREKKVISGQAPATLAREIS
jgi:hypothetical protein